MVAQVTLVINASIVGLRYYGYFFSKKSLATDYLVFEDVTNLVVPSSKQVCLQHYNDAESIFPVSACVPD